MDEQELEKLIAKAERALTAARTALKADELDEVEEQLLGMAETLMDELGPEDMPEDEEEDDDEDDDDEDDLH